MKLHHPVHLAQLAPAPVLQVQELRQLQLDLPLASGAQDVTPLKRSGWTPLPKTARADLPFEVPKALQFASLESEVFQLTLTPSVCACFHICRLAGQS